MNNLQTFLGFIVSIPDPTFVPYFISRQYCVRVCIGRTLSDNKVNHINGVVFKLMPTRMIYDNYTLPSTSVT